VAQQSRRVLNSGHPQADGLSAFTSATLSRGLHWISVSVTDGDGKQSSDSVSVHNDSAAECGPATPRGAGRGLLLTWTPPVEPDFAEYHVYRATRRRAVRSPDRHLTNPSASSVSRRDRDAGGCLLLSHRTHDHDWRREPEQCASGAAGVFIAMGTRGGFDSMIVDPTRPFIYAIDRVNSTLVFIHRDSLKITKKIFIGSGPQVSTSTRRAWNCSLRTTVARRSQSSTSTRRPRPGR
jgi:hypothetical protein